VRSPVSTFLDLATGCGVEAILASSQATRVVATDVNARAINYAAFNAQLNGVTNIAFRLGSWFAPVGDERFGVIACNPPYVISPSTDFLFRDSGLPGDSVSELVVRGIPSHLEEGGFATIAISWVADPDAAADSGPVRSWVKGTGCDAWLLHYRTDEPLATAAGWNQTEAGDPVRHAALIDSWMAYYRQQGIRAIAYGSLVLRRRSDATNWFRVDPLPPVRMRPASDHILRIFAAHDFLAGLENDGLLEARVATVPTLRLEQRVKFADGAPQIEAMNVTVDEGLGFQAVIEPRAVLLLSRLDGQRRLREALLEAAVAERTPAEATERYVAAGLAVVRRMLELGMLVRA
jgi:methylase of polypeptide subunit release factors